MTSPATHHTAQQGWQPWMAPVSTGGQAGSRVWGRDLCAEVPPGRKSEPSQRSCWASTFAYGELASDLLTHMSGRVYDYRLGRFLSVDPIISNPANSQSINPYSYIGNNPLSGTDPTGYMVCKGGGVEGGPNGYACLGDDGPGGGMPHPWHPTWDGSGGDSGAKAAGTTLPTTEPDKVGSSGDINKGGSISIPTVGDLADGWEMDRQSYREWLGSRLTPGTTLGEKAGLATLTLSVELGAGLVNLGRLGKGASDGGVRGWAEDGLRAAGLSLMGWGLSRSLLLQSEAAVTSLSPSSIRFSQSSVTGVEEIAASMRTSGWRGAPIDVVRLNDGSLVALDNTRVLAAQRAGIQVQATVHDAADALPKAFIERFTTPKGGVPGTWGDALNNRIQGQSAGYRTQYPTGSNVTGSQE